MTVYFCICTNPFKKSVSCLIKLTNRVLFSINLFSIYIANVVLFIKNRYMSHESFISLTYMQITIFFIKINQIKTVSLFIILIYRKESSNLMSVKEHKKMSKKSVEILVITLHMQCYMMSEDVRQNLL